MKVLHVVYNSHPDVTGAAVRTRYLVATQARLGVWPVVLSSPFQPPVDPAAAHGVESCHGIPHYRCYNGCDPARFLAAGKPWWERAVKLAWLGTFVRRIREVARQERVDLLHAHNLFFCGLAAEAAGRSLGLPVVYEVRSLVEESMEGAGAVVRSTCRRMDDLTCRLASHVTVLCRGLADEMTRRGLPDARITVAGNGVDLDAHRPEPASCRSDRFTLGFAGTLVAYEGLDLLLDAVAHLAPRHPHLHVLVVGDGPALPQLEQQVQRLGLQSRVEFTGGVPHDRIGGCYTAVDLFVLPRRSSRLTDLVTPLKPLEIMAHARPLLASDCGGHRELILDGVNGALFPAGAPAALARRIEDLMTDPDGLARLGRQAREWVSRHRSWDSQCRPVIELYERLRRERDRGIVLVGPRPGPQPTGGVENGIGLLLASPLAHRHRLQVWDRSRPPGPRPLRVARQLWRLGRFGALLARWRPRVVHVKSSAGANFAESAAYAALGRLLRRRVLLQIHSGEFEGWYRRQSPAGQWAIRCALQIPSDILVLSRYWQDRLQKLAPGRPIHIVPNGVVIPPAVPRDLPQVSAGGPQHPTSNTRDPRGQAPNGVLKVLTIGTLGRHKGHFEILEAAARLRRRPIRFLLAGPDHTSGRGDGAALRRRAIELGLNGQVVFSGPVGPDRKWELLADADLFVLPSHAEAMPNAVLEAMAAGLPVVATPVGALPEMLPDGIWVPVGDPQALAEVLLELAEDPVRRRQLGQRNRRRVEALYGFDRVLDALEPLYL